MIIAQALAFVTLASPLPVVETRLANGVELVLAPDPSASSVVVHVRYEGGAAADSDACSGCAKLAERLLRTPAELDARVDTLGGWTSSEAAVDHVATTTYVPPGALAFAVWLEAERAARARDASADARARAAVDIDAERRAAYEDHPIAIVARDVQQLLWDDDPYGHLVLVATPSPATGDVRGYLAPARAIVVIGGRFERARAEELARRYFGISSGRARARAGEAAIRPRTTSRRRVVTDPIAKAVVAFRFAADAADAIEVASRIVATRSARKLVGGGRASDVHAELERRERGGEVRFVAVAAPGVDPVTLVAPIEAQLAALSHDEATADELARAVASLDLDLVTAFEGLAYRAAELARWQALYHRADRLDVARKRPRDVTANAVQSAAAIWLVPNAQVTVVGRAR